MTSGPSRPRPEGSSAQRGAPAPSPTPRPPPSWRSAPRLKHDAPRPATSQSPHPRPTDRSRPSQNNASWRRGNHPPLQQLAPPPIPVDRVEVSFVLPPTQEKQKTWEPPTPAAVRTVTCTQTGRWEASPGIRRDRWETTDPGVRTSSFAARAWCATSEAAASRDKPAPGSQNKRARNPLPLC